MEAESAWRKRWNAARGESEVEKQAVTGFARVRMADMVYVAGMSALLCRTLPRSGVSACQILRNEESRE